MIFKNVGKRGESMAKNLKPVSMDDTSKRKDRREHFAKFTEENSKIPELSLTAPATMTPHAKAVYGKLVPQLNEAGFARDLDIYLVFAFCESWAMYLDAIEEIGINGITIETARGITKNPAFNVANDSLQKALSIARQIGLTPTSRNELFAIAGDGSDDDNAPDVGAMFGF